MRRIRQWWRRLSPRKSKEDFRREAHDAIRHLRRIHNSYEHRQHLRDLEGTETWQREAFASALFRLTSCEPAWIAEATPLPSRWWWLRDWQGRFLKAIRWEEVYRGFEREAVDVQKIDEEGQ